MQIDAHKLPLANARRILGSDIRRFPSVIPGYCQYVLQTWFIDRDGEKDCLFEDIGEPFPARSDDLEVVL